ncbi:MAG: helicase-related protein, partial [Sphingomonas parapaucimobilis]
MTSRVSGAVTAVLGPTNTGKTHLAIERMCAHSSGIIGFPLRLLAREVYDRVVALKGPGQVALVTGEEKIVPPDARWFLCTAESMPDRDVAFMALDEAQLGADLERGHVFTDRLLHRRGRDETMILGSEALKPMIRALVPDAEIIARPRFSTLTYAGARKISRLPKRSAIVAFSAEEVYAVAEMLRRLRGGAAVVMGALSPRTRNAQVEMFQAGEVDYLVATDAIGMGLNMDVAHVAFAGLHKFDGRRRRRLTVAEMAQIAGRAGRHHRDGTFGALAEEGPDSFLPEEVLAIEEHRFPRLDHLYWREGDPDLSSIDALIGSLERKPAPGVLRAAPLATDLQVLKRLADEPWVRDRVRRPAMV